MCVCVWGGGGGHKTSVVVCNGVCVCVGGGCVGGNRTKCGHGCIC